MKYAILSMDVEEWYHLDYFNDDKCNRNYSMLDGIDVFREVLSSYSIKGNFFVVGELAKTNRHLIYELIRENHDVGYHGWNHTRPLNMSISSYYNELHKSKLDFENIIGKSIIGYRAPCFSIDRERLNIIKDVGFRYDSSRISFREHALYGTVNMDGFEKLSPNIYKLDNFFEFQISTYNFLGRNIPVSGGGYLRLLPWGVMNNLITRYLGENELYVMYIHPFELSKKTNPRFPMSTKWYNRSRFSVGRKSTVNKLIKLIKLLRDNNYSIVTYSELMKTLNKNS
jgi:polysaccharide deacetylase family protein (PEP-CTERM system associated)